MCVHAPPECTLNATRIECIVMHANACECMQLRQHTTATRCQNAADHRMRPNASVCGSLSMQPTQNVSECISMVLIGNAICAPHTVSDAQASNARKMYGECADCKMQASRNAAACIAVGQCSRMQHNQNARNAT